MGWMPFDDKTGLRIGKVMLTATERCSRDAAVLAMMQRSPYAGQLVVRVGSYIGK
jgi:hypothetical protein